MDNELGSQRRHPSLLISSVFNHPLIVSAVFAIFSLCSPLFVASAVVMITTLCLAFCRQQTGARTKISPETYNQSKPEVGIEEEAETRNGFRSNAMEKHDFSPEGFDDVSDTLSMPESTITLLESDNIESSDGSISDDDSLIEISLPGRNYLEDRIWRNGFPSAQIPKYLLQKLDFPVMESQTHSFRRKTIMDFAPELMEEDNLIEIDISMGSIKCPTVKIQA